MAPVESISTPGWTQTATRSCECSVHGGSRANAERVVLTLQTVATKPGCPCRVNLGKRYGTARLPAMTPNLQPFTHISRIVTVPANGYVQLNLDPRGPTGSPAGQSVLLSSVEVTAA